MANRMAEVLAELGHNAPDPQQFLEDVKALESCTTAEEQEKVATDLINKYVDSEDVRKYILDKLHRPEDQVTYINKEVDKLYLSAKDDVSSFKTYIQQFNSRKYKILTQHFLKRAREAYAVNPTLKTYEETMDEEVATIIGTCLEKYGIKCDQRITANSGEPTVGIVLYYDSVI